MMTLPSQQNNAMPAWWVGSVLALSFLGILDSVYLTARHYLNFEVPCSLTQGCEQVLQSAYATVFGIPVALLGVLYYSAILILTVAFLDRRKPAILRGAAFLPIPGFLVTLWFVFTQVFLLNAFCLYCMFSAFLTTCLFALSLYYFGYGYIEGFRRKRGV